MRLPVRILLLGLLAVLLAGERLEADPGDVESSRDYPGFPRLPSFIISDYDEDNPSSFDFPVGRPLPTDAAHIETVHVKGHRYIIRYERASESVSRNSVFQTQQYYEKLAVAAGFGLVKSGAVGDVTETFRQRKGDRETWVYLEPGMSVNVLTIVESGNPVTLPPSTAVADDPLYLGLSKEGHVVLPLTFLPGKPDVDAEMQPLLDRVMRILKAHPSMQLIIEGHTDSAGDAQENQLLSARRAQAVRAVLIADGIDKDRLTAAGFGGTKPVADNGTPDGRAKNRRIELVVVKKS